jgi:hypothetical protein
MVLHSVVSFRACNLIVKLLRPFLPSFRGAPAPNTVESWLLRLGLHELQRPKEKSHDWFVFIDHMVQLGSQKCVLIVGIRQADWEQRSEPLTHHDLSLLALEPVAESDGERVAQQLRAVVQQVGTPLAVVNDEGSDLTNGAARFHEEHKETLVLNDIAHKVAVFLKRELLSDPRWDVFVRQCGQTQPKVKQTELGHLAPPTLKMKARYMNLSPLIRWGAKMLQLVDTPAADRPTQLELSRLEAKFGWIGDFRQALVDWNDLAAVKGCVLKYARRKGYHANASQELRRKLRRVVKTAAGKRLANQLVEFVREQSKGIPAGKSYPASTEVLESLIGKGKRLQGQHSREGFTKMILGMAASVVRITNQRVQAALESVSTAHLADWCKHKIGRSLTAQRRQALPALPGTKVG